MLGQAFNCFRGHPSDLLDRRYQDYVVGIEQPAEGAGAQVPGTADQMGPVPGGSVPAGSAPAGVMT